MYPGKTAFTLTPAGPNSAANDLVSPSTPALLATYAALPAPPCVANKELMFTITPPLAEDGDEGEDEDFALRDCESIFLAMIWEPQSVPIRFVCMIASICEGEVRIKKLEWVWPAAFIRTSILACPSSRLLDDDDDVVVAEEEEDGEGSRFEISRPVQKSRELTSPTAYP